MSLGKLIARMWSKPLIVAFLWLLTVVVVSDGRSTRRKLPDALIIGVKKGGTRALLQFMRLHPDVKAPGPEVHFFDKNYDKGLDWYRSRMPHILPGQLVMEKTPAYFVDPAVPQRVHAMNPNISLILLIREPITRAISDYAQAAAKHKAKNSGTPLKSFEELVFLPNGQVDASRNAIRVGLYSRHLTNWYRYFPTSQVLVVPTEELIRRPFDVVRRVESFLGLAPVVTRDHFYFDTVKGFYCMKKHWKTGRPHCLGRGKGRTHPRIHPSVVQRLRNFYRPHNALFFRQTGVDFGWNRPAW